MAVSDSIACDYAFTDAQSDALAGVVLCFCGGDVCTCGREEIACPDCDGCPIPAADEGGEP